MNSSNYDNRYSRTNIVILTLMLWYSSWTQTPRSRQLSQSLHPNWTESCGVPLLRKCHYCYLRTKWTCRAHCQRKRSRNNSTCRIWIGSGTFNQQASTTIWALEMVWRGWRANYTSRTSPRPHKYLGIHSEVVRSTRSHLRQLWTLQEPDYQSVSNQGILPSRLVLGLPSPRLLMQRTLSADKVRWQNRVSVH